MIPGDADDPFMTVAEVADVLKLNQQTVRNWIDQGSLPALRVGRRVRIRRSDFQRLIDEGYKRREAPPLPEPTGPSAEDFWSGDLVGVPESPRVLESPRGPDSPRGPEGPPGSDARAGGTP